MGLGWFLDRFYKICSAYSASGSVKMSNSSTQGRVETANNFLEIWRYRMLNGGGCHPAEAKARYSVVQVSCP